MPTSIRRRRSATGPAVLLACMLVAAGAHALDVGTPMPELGLVDLAGKRIDRGSLQGRVVVVDFWATWCAPCKQELPVLQRLQDKYGKHGLTVVAVSVDEDVGRVRKFVRKLGLKLRVVHDARHALAERFGPQKMPSSYIVDRGGRVRHVHAGYRTGDARALEAEIRALLAERTGGK